MPDITLRPIVPGDLDAIFAQMRDPESVHMAAFTAADPDDRATFDAHTARVMASSESQYLAIDWDSQLVGTAGSWVVDGVTEVTYRIDRAYWGQGIATRALERLIATIPARPIQARVASDNPGSLRVLAKAGFHPVGSEVSFAPGRGHEIEETILELR